MHRRAIINICIVQLLSAPVFCQILQNHAALCGDKTRPADVPPGVVATIDKSNGTATLGYGPGKAMALQGANAEIQEVCPLLSNKLVVFGFNSVGYEINIVDLMRGEVSDSLVASDPVMSPNRRWLASRHFLPPQSELQLSDEYLLYDLGSSPVGNRHHATPYTSDAEGGAMYPAFPDYAPVDLLDIPEANRHAWQSKAFFWAPDSQSVIFADSVGDQLTLVLVLIGNDRPGAYTYPISAAEVCSGSGNSTKHLMLNDESINPLPGNSLNIVVTFEESGDGPGCQPRRLSLNRANFQPAKVESYEHRKLNKSTPAKVIGSKGDDQIGQIGVKGRKGDGRIFLVRPGQTERSSISG
jgi:hypothetical protein